MSEILLLYFYLFLDYVRYSGNKNKKNTLFNRIVYRHFQEFSR